MKKSIEQIVQEAFNSAREAELEYVRNNENWWPCGFAWVVIKPSNSKLAKYLVEHRLGRKSSEGGVRVWAPGGTSTQNMDAKYDGAMAFVNSLKVNGFEHAKITAECRMD